MEYNKRTQVPHVKMSGSHRGNEPPVTWDTEEDHLLSYFLEEANGLNQEAQSSRNPHVTYSNLSVATNPSFRQSNPSQSPNTPAVQFYPSNGSNNKKSSPVPVSMPLGSSSSSSSSLDAMAATLVNGGPVLQHHQQLQHPQQSLHPYPPSPSSGISPISPAATMGTPQEMLMLPPQQRPTTEAERQKHLAWVNQVKSRASMVPSMYGPTAPNLNVQATSTTYASQPPRETESQERRARRLARNRESARQSRRRKKERLANLSCQVSKLHSQLDHERRRLFEELEPALQELRRKMIDKMENEKDNTRRLEMIQETFTELGPNCLIRKEAISYQYAALEKLMLPKHQIFILWLTLQEGGFFTAGKEERAKTEGTNNRISSKQIGEELTNKWKGGTKKNKAKAGKGNTTGSTEMIDESGMSTLTARSNEPYRLWPLFSYDMSISVDQEERVVQFHQQSQAMGTLADDRCEISDAMKLVQNMKRGILSQCQATVGRNERLLLDILEPEQSVNFLRWCQKNVSRYESNSNSMQHTDKGKDISCENSISDVCQRIKQIMILPEESVKDQLAEYSNRLDSVLS